MTIREQINALPEPYRSMAMKYEKDQRWGQEWLSSQNWDEEFNWRCAFRWEGASEGRSFWREVHNASLGLNPYPPVPEQAAGVEAQGSPFKFSLFRLVGTSPTGEEMRELVKGGNSWEEVMEHLFEMEGLRDGCFVLQKRVREGVLGEIPLGLSQEQRDMIRLGEMELETQKLREKYARH